jgi:phosphate transport system permease protein
MPDAAMTAQAVPPRRPHQRRMFGLLTADDLFRRSVQLTGLLVLLTLGAIILMLSIGAWPALRAAGLPFFWLPTWDPVNEEFGAGIMVYGTIITSLIALVVAVPLSAGAAYFLTEILPNGFRKLVGTAIQLLAAVPSIIFGMWGFFVLAPLMTEFVIFPIADFFAPVPILNRVFDYGVGNSIFTAGLVLAVMILPLITAMFVEILNATPTVLKEATYGLGATRFEVFRDVALPYGRRAMIGAVMLGLGRALGETMAVTFVIGNATRLSPNLFAQGATIASTIANEFNEAVAGSLKLSALLGLGLTLFIITFLVLLAARRFVVPKVGL